MNNTGEQIDYNNKVNKEFAEAMYQKMASKRYGIDFCCTPDLNKWSIKKELLDFNDKQIDICSSCNSDNPAQPGDFNYVSKGCGKLDITTESLGGTISYVPCGSFRRITETFSGTDTHTICYDICAGYTATPIDSGCEPCFITTESTEKCISSKFCKSYEFTNLEAEATSIINFTSCEGTLFTIPISPLATFGPICILEDEYSILGNVTVLENDYCTETSCQSLQFSTSRDPISITYIDYNNELNIQEIPSFTTADIICAKAYVIDDESRPYGVVVLGDCSNCTS
jgi:hypothetical protein